MADPIIATSEFDPSAFIKGIDGMTAALQELQIEEDNLRKKLQETTSDLAHNKAAITATAAEITKLDKTSKTYNDDLARLSKQQAALNQQQRALQDGVKTSRKELEQVNTTAKTYKDALAGITAVAKQVQSELKGKTLFDVATLNQQVQDILETTGRLRDVFKGTVDTGELEQLEDALAGAKDEFEQLRVLVPFLQEQLADLDPNSEEFADLSRVIETSNELLKTFGETQEDTTGKTKSLRTQLRVLRDQLAELETAGQDNTEEFEQLQLRAAELEDQIGDTQARIRALASDTKNLDFGIGVVRGLASAFGLVEGTAALVGLKNEEVEESLQRLNAILVVLNSLQEIQNLLQKQSIVNLVGQQVATKAYALSQRILAAALGTTAAQSRALNVALLTTGIGALVAVIGLLISALQSWANAAQEAAEAQQNLNVAIDQGVRDNELFIAGLEDAGRRLALQGQLRQAAAERLNEAELEGLRRRVREEQELRDIELKALRQQVEQARRFEESRVADGDRAAARLRDIAAQRVDTNEDEIDALQATVEAVDKAIDTRVELENRLETALLQNQLAGLKARNELRRAELRAQDDFLKRLEELRKRLLDVQNEAARQDAAQLVKTARDNLAFELRGLEREVQEGRLTRQQAGILGALLGQITDVQVAEELETFRRRVTEAARNLEDQLVDLRLRVGEERAALLRDELEREATLIELETRRQTRDLIGERDELLRGVQEAFDEGLISEERAATNAQRIELIYDELLRNLAAQTRRRQEELANLTFQRSLQLVRDLFAPSLTVVSEAATAEIQAVTAQFIRGRIRYEEYQRRLTEITRQETARRIQLQITETEQLLAGVRAREQAELDPTRREQLQRQILQLREQLAQLRRQLAAGEAEEAQADRQAFNERVARIQSYAQAIGGLVEQIIGFWQRSTEAEEAALNRSVQLQESRVAAATRIAERGNAEYLRLEEDRLNELRIQQEEAARRQLAINAALQATQALTAFTGALAQGASTGGVAGALIAVTGLLALLASGFAIVQSLQPEPPSFYQGTHYVEQGNNPAGRDTVPAMLNVGEAVIPTEQNRRYRAAVAAILDGTVSPDSLNAFVATRPDVPVPAYDAMGDAATLVLTRDGRLAEATEAQNRRLEENNSLLRDVVRALHSIGVDVNIDRNGLAMSLLGVIDHNTKQRKA